MNFKKIFNTIMTELGFVEKAKNKELTDDDWKKIAESYKEKTGHDFYNDANMSEDDRRRLEAHDKALEMLDDGQPETAQTENPENAPQTTSQNSGNDLLHRIEQLQNENRTLKTENQALAAQTEHDDVTPQKIAVMGLARQHTADFAFGIEHDLFSAKKRWNKITMRQALDKEADDEDFDAFQTEVKSFGKRVAARMRELHEQGSLIGKALQQIDYSHLADAGLGEQFVVRRVDALISQIIQLPSVFHIFPLQSYVQDQTLITNAFFDEFSQAYQSGELSKGGAELKPEKAKVHDAMFKHLFESMKWIETQYIGYLNTNGSDPTKWSMIEWMILEIAKVLANERNVRAVQGCRVEPVKGENSSFLNASTGIIHRLISYVEDFKILPFEEADYADYNATNMVDVVENFAGEVHAILESTVNKVLYLNEKHKPWYMQSYRKKYGKDTDFTDGIRIMNYDFPIVWVPNMGNLKFMFIQDRGNMKCLEFIPGEMYSVRFEQRLENVWGYSVWKEGTGAAYSGKKFDSYEELVADERKHQVIFINKPVTKVAPDAVTLNAKENFWFVTGANTKATVITNIERAESGVVYKIECGSTANASTIAKSGKFEDLTAAWTPNKVGAWIKVLYNKETGKFREVERSK